MKKFICILLSIIFFTCVLCSCSKDNNYDPVPDGFLNDTQESDKTDPVDTKTDFDIPFAKELSYDYELNDYIILPDYKNVPIEYDRQNTDEKFFDDQITFCKLSAASLTPADRAAEEGDVIIFNYSGVYADTEKEAVKGENVKVILGKDMFAPGFDEKLIGLSKGENKTFVYTFPNDWTNITKVTGKAVKFTVNMVSVNTAELPELTPEILSSLGYTGISNEEELKLYITDYQNNQNSAKYLDALINKSEVIKYPEKEFKYHCGIFEANALGKLGNSVTLETMIKTEYGTAEAYEKAQREYASNECKKDMVISYLLDKYELSLTKEQYNQGLAEYYRDYKDTMSFESIEDAHEKMGQSLAEALSADLAAKAVYTDSYQN